VQGLKRRSWGPEDPLPAERGAERLAGKSAHFYAARNYLKQWHRSCSLTYFLGTRARWSHEWSRISVGGRPVGNQRSPGGCGFDGAVQLRTDGRCVIRCSVVDCVCAWVRGRAASIGFFSQTNMRIMHIMLTAMCNLDLSESRRQKPKSPGPSSRAEVLAFLIEIDRGCTHSHPVTS